MANKYSCFSICTLQFAVDILHMFFRPQTPAHLAFLLGVNSLIYFNTILNLLKEPKYSTPLLGVPHTHFVRFSTPCFKLSLFAVIYCSIYFDAIKYLNSKYSRK